MSRLAIEIAGLSVVLDGSVILTDLSLSVAEGEMVGLIGPNGSGKTTLLRVLWRSIAPTAGTIGLEGQDLLTSDRRQVAQRLAAITQEEEAPSGLSVREAVAMGRTPHKRSFAADDARDIELVTAALEQMKIASLADRDLAALSGGERQRVRIARAFVQEPKVLLLDEPTNHLDIRHQIELLELVRRSGLTVLAALHDLNLAAAFCDRLILLAQGRVVAQGLPRDVLRPELIAEVYGIRPSVVTHPETGAPRLIFGP